MPAQLFLHQLQLGPMQNFVYLVGTEGERDVVVVDPAWDVDAIEKTDRGPGDRPVEPQVIERVELSE